MTTTPHNLYYAYDYFSMSKRFNEVTKRDYSGAKQLCDNNGGILAHAGLGNYPRAREMFFDITGALFFQVINRLSVLNFKLNSHHNRISLVIYDFHIFANLNPSKTKRVKNYIILSLCSEPRHQRSFRHLKMLKQYFHKNYVVIVQIIKKNVFKLFTKKH